MKRQHLLILLVLAVTIGLAIILRVRPELLLEIARWAETSPEQAWPIYLVSFVLAIILMVPGWMFMVAAGYLFGVLVGGLLAFIANMAGSILAFYLAKSLARRWVEEKLARNDRFQGFDEAARRNGMLSVMLARLAMLPNNLLNYACGLTAMRLRDFTLGTALGSLPLVVANVLIGASSVNLFGTMENGALQSPQPVIGKIAMIVAGLVGLALIARKISRKTMGPKAKTEIGQK